MKNWILVLVMLAVGMMAASCIVNLGSGSLIVGHCTEEGIDYTEVRDVAPFHAISSGLPCNIYYEQGPKQEVRVESTQEFAGKVITEVENGTLKIKLEEGKYPNLILRMVISSPDIDGIKITGSGHLVNEGGIHAGGGLDLTVSGSGSIGTGDIDGKDLTAHVSGSGSLRLPAVSCADFSGKVSGSGSVQVEKVSCTGFSAHVSGSGHIAAQTARVKGNLSAVISGSGRVRLEDAKVDGDMALKTTGAGGITVNGSCRNVEATTSGSGSISGDLTYDNIRSHSTGSGKIKL